MGERHFLFLVAKADTGCVSLSGTVVYARAGMQLLGLIEADLAHGWRRSFDDQLHFPASEHAIELSQAGPVLVACVLSSDYCEIAGAVDAELLWSWRFGEAPLPYAVRTEMSEAEAAACAQQAAGWATRAGLRPPDRTILTTVLDQGHVPVDAAIRAVVAELGLEARLLAPEFSVLYPNSEAPSSDYPDDGRHSWRLRVNIIGDLFERLDELAAWLAETRELFITPLITTYPPGAVRVSIDPHEQFAGESGGLIVTSGGWSRKNRPVFGAGDDAGWTRKLRQLSKGELREISIEARSLGPNGRTWQGDGSLKVEAVIRDQLVTQLKAPLPPEHPAYLQVDIPHDLAARLPKTDFPATLADRGRLAVEHFQAESAFVEIARPLYYPADERVPLSPTAWLSGLTQQPGDK